MPHCHQLFDLGRDLQRRIDCSVRRFQRSAFANFQDSALARGLRHGDHWLGAELPAQSPTRGAQRAVQESLLVGHEQIR
jgi:hypothetical protein